MATTSSSFPWGVTGTDRVCEQRVQRTFSIGQGCAGTSHLLANCCEVGPFGARGLARSESVTGLGDESAAAWADHHATPGGEQSDRRLSRVNGDPVLAGQLPVRGQLVAGSEAAGVDLVREQLGEPVAGVSRSEQVVLCGFSHESERTDRLKTAVDPEEQRSYCRNTANRLKTVARPGVGDMGSNDEQIYRERFAPLSEGEQRAVRRRWEQLIREEWVPAVRPMPRSVPLAELDERRERRSARRAVARIAAAGRVAQVRRLAPSMAISGGFGPGEAA